MKGKPLFITEEQAFTISDEDLTAKNLPNSSDPPSKKRFTYGKFTPCATFCEVATKEGPCPKRVPSLRCSAVSMTCCSPRRNCWGFIGGASPPGSAAARRSRWRLWGVSGDDSDKAVWGHFRRHWQCLFPGLGSRSVFVRQAANLWFVKQRL